MTTASHIINRAFSKIGVRAAETALTASEVQDGLDALNDMLSEWDAVGTLKGAFPVKEPGDSLSMPRYADGAVKANLALRLAPEYDREITPAMQDDARNSLSNLITASVNLNNTKYPATLPTGSGNTGSGFGVDSDFFPDDKVRKF